MSPELKQITDAITQATKTIQEQKTQIEILKNENHLLRHMLCIINKLSKDMYDGTPEPSQGIHIPPILPPEYYSQTEREKS